MQMTDSTSSSARHVIAYYTSWSIYKKPLTEARSPYDLRSFLPSLSHLIYAFLKVHPDSGRVCLADPWADIERPLNDALVRQAEAKGIAIPSYSGNLGEIVILRQLLAPSLRLGLSVGGWNARHHFPVALSSSTKISTFVASCASLLQQFGFQFIDIDWEYPACKQDAQLLLLLLQEFRHHDIVVTLAMPAHIDSPELCFPSAQHMVDLVHLFLVMTYDYAGPWSSLSDHLSPLSKVASSMDVFLGLKYPADRLVVGIPLYARKFEQCRQLHGSFKKCSGVADADILSYRQVCSILRDQQLTSKVVLSEGGCHVIHKDALISFESCETFKQKLAKFGSSFGGFFFWELAGDLALEDHLSILRQL